MATYGYDFYGVGKYGTTSLIEFDARPFEALSIDYDRLLLSWRSPAGDWDRLRLTRDSNGYAPRYDMGLVLIDTTSSGAPTTFLDQFNISPGSFYYYTVWVRNAGDGVWRRAADTTGLAVKNWANSERLYELIPTVYRDKDHDTVSARIYGKGPLERYLQIFGYQLDHIRTEYETLKDTNNADKVAGGLLPLLTKQWGFGFESELGMRLARIQARNAVHLYKLKGTRLGVEGFVSAMTGWAPTVTAGVNLMLDQNDSMFYESLGRWGVEVGSAALARIDGLVAGLGQAVPTPSGSSTGDIGSGPYVMRITPTAAGDVTVALLPSAGMTASAWRQGLIPVAASTAYTFSFYMRSNVARTIRPLLQAFTATGDSVGAETMGASVSTTTTGWTRITYTLTTGTTTAFLRLLIRVGAAATTDLHYLAAVQLEAAGAATAFQSARSIRIKLAAERINMVKNGSLEVNAGDWTAAGPNTIARSTAQALHGSASLALTSTAAGRSSAYSEYGSPVVAGRTYTASVSFRAAATARQVRLRLQWDNAIPAVISSWGGPWVTSNTTGWTRASVTAVAPAGAVNFRVWIEIDGTVLNEVHYADGVLMEEGAVLRDYFDGAIFSPEGEYVWQGTPGNSPSHYYSRRLIKNFRLNQRLNEFLPSGSTYALIYATP